MRTDSTPVDDYRNAGQGNWLHRTDYVGRTLAASRTTFRLQVHQQYLVPAEREAFATFRLTGERHIDPGNTPVLAQMRARVGAGKKPQRVQVVTPPLTDYLRYAFRYFHHSAEAGEDLRILDTNRDDAGDLPDYDFMLIDDETVIKVHYEPDDGTIIGPELLPEAAVDEYVRYKENALRNAAPFLEYETSIATENSRPTS